MAVDFDAFSASATGTGNLSWTHTPFGTPRGVIVYVSYDNTIVNQISGVTYGGVAMTEVSLSPVLYDGTEDVQVAGFFLGSSIPTGAQTVAVTVSGANNKIGYCNTVTAAANTEVQATAEYKAPSTSPNGTISLGGASCFVSQGWSSGLNDPGATPLTGWTERDETDFGFRTSGCSTYDTIGTSDVAYGYTGSDESALLAVAIKESAGASGITGTGALTNSAVTASGSGTIAHTGTGAASTNVVTASGAGVISHTGTGSPTTTAATLSGTGTATGAGVTGTGAIAVGAVTTSGTGKLTHISTGALSGNVVSIAGSGKLTHSGTGALTNSAATLSGSGFLGLGITGTGAIAIGNVLVSGTGNRIGWDAAPSAAGSWADAAGGAGTWTDKVAASGTWN